MLKVITSAVFFVSSKSSVRLRVISAMSNVETPANGGGNEGTEQDSKGQNVAASEESPESTQTKETLKRPLDDKDNAAASNSGEAATSNDSIVDSKSKRPAPTAQSQSPFIFWISEKVFFTHSRREQRYGGCISKMMLMYMHTIWTQMKSTGRIYHLKTKENSIVVAMDICN